MEYAGIIVSIVGSLVAVAVSWGVISARIEEMRREMTDLRSVVRECPTKESCVLKHAHITETMNDIRTQLKEIKELIKEISGRRSDE